MDQEFLPINIPRDDVISSGVNFHDSSSAVTVDVSGPLSILKNPVVSLMPLLIRH